MGREALRGQSGWHCGFPGEAKGAKKDWERPVRFEEGGGTGDVMRDGGGRAGKAMRRLRCFRKAGV